MSAQLVLVLAALIAVPGVACAAKPYIDPWTPPSLRGSSVSCWGRSYDYRESLLPSRLLTQGRDILAGPIRLEGTVQGRKVGWGKSSFEAGACDTEAARYITSVASPELTVHCDFVTEFDGTTRVDLSVTPNRPIKVDSLDLIIPFRPEYAKFFHHSSVYPVHVWDWPTKRMNSGAIGADGLKLPFVFHLWIGDDDRGLQIFSETDEAWSPADPQAAITLTPGRRDAVLRMNLLANVELSNAWNWTFGFVATPVKPWPKQYYSEHYCHMGGYGEEVPPDAQHPSYLDQLAQMGVKYLGFHESWSDEQSLPRPTEANKLKLKSLTAACRAKGIGLVPYTGCYMSTRSPEYNKDWDSYPIGDHYQYQRPDNQDICRIVCNNTGYPDLLLRLYTSAFEEYGLGGIYMDGFSSPIPCTNRKHGCGYIGKDGEIHPTMPIWKTREAMKAWYRLVKCRPNPGIIVSHMSSSVLLPTLSFADFALDGEHLLSQKRIGFPEYPESILRAEMSGHNFGIPSTQLPISGNRIEKERARTLCLLYDSLMMWHPEHQSDIWKAWDSFGADKSEWVPFWRSGGLVTLTGPGDLRASAYLRKGIGALFVVANLSDKRATIRLAPDRLAIGLPADCRLSARDEAVGGELPVVGNEVCVTVGASTFKMVSVRAGLQ